MKINGKKIDDTKWNHIKASVFPNIEKPTKKVCDHHTELNGPICGKPATRGIIWGVFKVTPYCEDHITFLAGDAEQQEYLEPLKIVELDKE
jgi:hypothetical protein